MQRKIILIGGAPTVGKSTIAQRLSEHLNLPWISTDQIRRIMRCVAQRKTFPSLFTPEECENAERFLTKFSVEEIVQMEMEQGDVTWIGIQDLIANDHTWKDGFIIEGVNILPHLVNRDFMDDSSVRAVFLFDDNEERMRRVIYKRGLFSNATDYSDNVKEKEVEWAMLFGERLKKEVLDYGYSMVTVKKESADLQKILKIINET